MIFALVISPIPASLTTTRLPQIRLIALPILLHVFMVPGFSWLNEMLAKPRTVRASQSGFMLFMALLLTQGAIYRAQFSKAGPERWYIFDEQFPREVLPAALKEKKTPIYLYDPIGKSGYVEAYWYGLLGGIPADNFVRLAPDSKPPNGAVVISTEEECSNCQLLLKSINYIVFVAGKE